MDNQEPTVGMNFDQALQALMAGHQVYRDDQPFIFVATDNDPLRFYQLHGTEAGPWWPSDGDINADNYYLVEPRLHYKTAATSLGIVNAMKHLRAGHVISRPDHSDGAQIRWHSGALFAKQPTSDDWRAYQLTPQDMAAVSWVVTAVAPTVPTPANVQETAHG